VNKLERMSIKGNMELLVVSAPGGTMDPTIRTGTEYTNILQKSALIPNYMNKTSYTIIK
jgi:hypothetical protein